MSSSAVTFHVLATERNEILYYSAVANPQDDGVVLNYKAQDTSDQKIQQEIIQPLFISCSHFLPNQDGVSVSHSVTGNPDICERLSRIHAAFATCTIPPLHHGATGPSLSVVRMIGQQCRESFPNMNTKKSFIKLQSGHKHYDATCKPEHRNSPIVHVS